MTEERISPLRARMIEDMRIRGMGDKAQKSHIWAIKDLARFLGHSPDTATPEELRAYQLHMTDTGFTASTFNVRIVALRFFFGMTCGREDMKRYMQFRTQPRKLPVVFSFEEVSDILMAAPGPGLKYRAALSISYGAGLRAAEVCNLKIGDIDSDRMLIHVEQGKAYGPNNAILDNCHVRVSFATNDERTAKRVSDALGTATEMKAMRNYAGHRLAPWLGHLMVSRSETARQLLTPGEIMQLPADDEIVMVAGSSPIRAKKARYYLDRRFLERVLPPPEAGPVAMLTKPDGWAEASRNCGRDRAVAANGIKVRLPALDPYRAQGPQWAYSVEKLRLPEGLAVDSTWLRQLEVNGDDGVPAGSTRRSVLRILDRSAHPT